MKEKVNQLFRDKMVLVMLVLGLLTLVAAAGAVKIRKGNENLEKSPYLELEDPDGVIAGDEGGKPQIIGSSDARWTEEGAKAETANEEADAGALEAGVDNGEHVSETILSLQEDPALPKEEVPEAEPAGVIANQALSLDFTEEDRLSWPVTGNILIGYSMDTTTYFPTLDQYKCSPANVIQSEVSTPVLAPANARVMEIGCNEEIGNYVRLDMGNGYNAVCGQLKEILVEVNEYLQSGDALGYVAEPTKYYSVEGVNLYFELLKDDKPVDALDYLE